MRRHPGESWEREVSGWEAGRRGLCRWPQMRKTVLRATNSLVLGGNSAPRGRVPRARKTGDSRLSGGGRDHRTKEPGLGDPSRSRPGIVGHRPPKWRMWSGCRGVEGSAKATNARAIQQWWWSGIQRAIPFTCPRTTLTESPSPTSAMVWPPSIHASVAVSKGVRGVDARR